MSMKNTKIKQQSDVEFCDFCGGQMARERVTKVHRYHGVEQTFKNVEAEVCQQCGERYFHARTLKELDQMIAEEAA